MPSIVMYSLREGKKQKKKKKKKAEFKIARGGGLHVAEQCLGLRDLTFSKAFLDVVFVTIDLEVSRLEIIKPGAPPVKQFGIATLDTRHLRGLASPVPATASELIVTRQYSTSHASKEFLDCDVTDFRECFFAETFLVSQEDLPATITKHLRIRDETSSDPTALRNIVIAGHSTKIDITIIQRLGINVCEVAPVIAILDTHSMARNLFNHHSSTPMTSFTLGSLLTEMKCPHETSDLHNAGNDATFTLHALLMLVIRSSENRELLQSREKRWKTCGQSCIRSYMSVHGGNQKEGPWDFTPHRRKIYSSNGIKSSPCSSITSLGFANIFPARS